MVLCMGINIAKRIIALLEKNPHRMVHKYYLKLERTRFVLILRDRDNSIVLSRIKIKTIKNSPKLFCVLTFSVLTFLF